MIERCRRCNRKLTGFASIQLGIGPVCIAKSHRQKEAEASGAQTDLFASELAAATLHHRVQNLIARLKDLEARQP